MGAELGAIMTIDPGVLVAIIMAVVNVVTTAVLATIFIVKMGGKIDTNNATVVGKLDNMDTRVQHVETSITDLKNTDRRLTTVEERQAALAIRQGNIEKDNLLIREDLGSLHQGLDRHSRSLDRFNDGELGK